MPDLAVIEEKGDECTGMEQVKALLKNGRKNVENSNVDVKKALPKEVYPMSEDIMARKKNILLREEIISKQVERLASLQQRYA